MGRGDETIGASIIWHNEHCESVKDGVCMCTYLCTFARHCMIKNNYVFALKCVLAWT